MLNIIKLKNFDKFVIQIYRHFLAEITEIQENLLI